jgi:serine/threonine protein kinase
VLRTKPFTSAEHNALSGAPVAAPPPAGSHALPEPDPAELRSPAGARVAEYAAGDVIEGRFEIVGILGQGGFSKVYRVRDAVESEERALKLFDSAAGYESVRREIGALRKIHHPNVVEVFWADKTAAGNWYLVTEFIDGEPLSEFVTGSRHLRDREAVDVALDLLDALVAFHPDSARLRQLDARRREGDLPEAESREWLELNGKGLIHRDIKPLNVMLTRTGAKLLDFNIASRFGDPVHTQSGTPPYQPPDAGLTRWDVSTDLFAVGVLLYQLLCNGHHPFPAARPVAVRPVTDPRAIRSSSRRRCAVRRGRASGRCALRLTRDSPRDAIDRARRPRSQDTVAGRGLSMASIPHGQPWLGVHGHCMVRGHAANKLASINRYPEQQRH